MGKGSKVKDVIVRTVKYLGHENTVIYFRSDVPPEILLKVFDLESLQRLKVSDYFHNEDGPAVVFPDGDYEYYLDGKYYGNRYLWTTDPDDIKVQKYLEETRIKQQREFAQKMDDLVNNK